MVYAAERLNSQGPHSTDELHDQTTPSSKESKKKIPIQADFYIAQATVKGHVSYRHKTKGSVFIEEFCSVLASARYNSPPARYYGGGTWKSCE